jgi:hypothetical protein
MEHVIHTGVMGDGFVTEYYRLEFGYTEVPVSEAAGKEANPIRGVPLKESGSDRVLLSLTESPSPIVRVFKAARKLGELSFAPQRSFRHDTGVMREVVLASVPIPYLNLMVTSSQETRAGPYFVNFFDLDSCALRARLPASQALDVLTWSESAFFVVGCGPEGRSIFCYDPRRFALARTMSQEDGAVRTMTAVPGQLANLIVTGADSGVLALWDLRRGE